MKTLIIILLILGMTEIGYRDEDGEKHSYNFCGICNLVVLILLLLGKWG